jgi:hypothetical protein
LSTIIIYVNISSDVQREKGGKMARKSKDDLAEFKKWLKGEYDISNGSSTVYASRVRAMLRKLSTLSVEEIDRVVQGLNTNSVNQHICAWKRFVKFCASKGIWIPEPSLTGSVTIKEHREVLPDMVVLALVNVLTYSRIPLSMLCSMRWKHIVLKGMKDWELQDPECAGYIYFASSNDMNIICDWANGIADIELERPFIPKAALSMIPMSRNAIARATNGRRRNKDR